MPEGVGAQRPARANEKTTRQFVTHIMRPRAPARSQEFLNKVQDPARRRPIEYGVVTRAEEFGDIVRPTDVASLHLWNAHWLATKRLATENTIALPSQSIAVRIAGPL